MTCADALSKVLGATACWRHRRGSGMSVQRLINWRSEQLCLFFQRKSSDHCVLCTKLMAFGIGLGEVARLPLDRMGVPFRLCSQIARSDAPSRQFMGEGRPGCEFSFYY
jgi:hypothetical protein